jgi:hypothetical protein
VEIAAQAAGRGGVARRLLLAGGERAAGAAARGGRAPRPVPVPVPVPVPFRSIRKRASLNIPTERRRSPNTFKLSRYG